MIKTGTSNYFWQLENLNIGQYTFNLFRAWKSKFILKLQNNILNPDMDPHPKFLLHWLLNSKTLNTGVLRFRHSYINDVILHNFCKLQFSSYFFISIIFVSHFFNLSIYKNAVLNTFNTHTTLPQWYYQQYMIFTNTKYNHILCEKSVLSEARFKKKQSAHDNNIF